MPTPASAMDPAWDSQDRVDEKSSEQVKESESRSYGDSFSSDPEKAIDSSSCSTNADEATLSSDSPAGAEQDPNIVDWDGPDDPKNPQNWSSRKKWGIIWTIGAITLITSIGSSFFAPGVPQVMRAFHETSLTISAFVVSVYLLGFATGPLVVAPMSELYGRRLIYNVSNVLFVIFSIACAASTSMGMLIAFRFLAGCAASAPLTLGGGTIADMFPREQRAKATVVWSIGPLLGPVLGPIGGGFLVQNTVWRWVFWIIAMFAGVSAVVFFFVGEETYHPIILARKTEALRKETGNMNLRSKLASDLPPKEIIARAIVRPMKMLILSPIVGLMSLYVAINYGILYLFFTTVTFVFEGQYGFSSGAVGLSFLGFGIGMLVGMFLIGLMSDKNITKHQNSGGAKPEHRLMLGLTVPGAISLPIGVFVYGWTTYHKVHWIVPIIFTSFIGLGNLTAMMTIQTYLIDAFTIYAASAIAASTVLRSVFGAFLPLAGRDMYKVLGLGWGNSLLGFLSLAVVPVPILFRIYGEKIRTNPKWQVQF
ncbi:AraJ Arabinose efflux permease [Pyrenophora tritici-repentis]|uniref:Arabinose efflux permease n=2 Tax=Pyrenophora tritici-repentis TaxID=45151 RepID=A0A2W1E215_9PLEO|nr:membrane transporter [Pyrenophora tritici-repentis Pt-1C-BFP]KAA8623126.1 AraJ Arabinose efflux permease [Pyrenophora tritici-repentis]EDU45324.1 membrane transporter [Pyrenophora tritici-repentis Pt-1C-BFP]KAF7452123.1 AraJ Arabinose efflux permease [Pyrenophora tritici-repentis]KAF7574761.1 AraJ, Arabinose efflux permease [Pyrenophora tritici-repentis]KAG9386469.1 AraJ Arabinose efflux permease [Pyrenophora tritici-repentis]